jgi:outer membrane lipoprotein SlyB
VVLSAACPLITSGNKSDVGKDVPYTKLFAKPPKPQLYPNQHLVNVGQAQSNYDIADCENLANTYVEENKGAEIAKKGATSAVIGGVIGAAAGAVRSGGSVSNTAATGAAMGAAGGTTKGIIDSNDPSTIYKNFVNRCLSDRGYDVMGWR